MSRVVIFFLIVAIVAVAADFAERADSLFDDFKAKFGRKYSSPEEDAKRRAYFKESMIRVDKKNILNGSPAFGITKFSDWSPEEFKVLLGFKRSRALTEKLANADVRSPSDAATYKMDEAAAKSSVVNWKKAAKITPVKNQGQCGSCWAFSAAEAIESQWAMNGNAIWEFSSQQIASCTQNQASIYGDCCFGCGGGDTVAAYEYLMSTVGLGSVWYAPYMQSAFQTCDGPSCTYECSNYNMADLTTYGQLTGPYATITGYSFATPACNSGSCNKQNMTMLAANTAIYGPPSVCVDASTWGDYTGGVLSQASCGNAADDIDHCVQLIGYNAGAKSPYWIVRNSWSTNWGISGMIHLQYPQNTCGVGNYATFVKIGNNQGDFNM